MSTFAPLPKARQPSGPDASRKDFRAPEQQRHASEENQQKQADSNLKGLEGAAVSPGLASQIKNTQGRGEALDAGAQPYMESRFGADFSKIRIHADSQAARMSRELNARAFTVGTDIYFNEGQYQPNSREGKKLLAHELTHTLQQSNGGIQRQESTGSETAASVGQQAMPIVEDSIAPAVGQMTKSDFLQRLNQEICSTVDQELRGTPYSSAGCPYIRAAFARHSASSPIQLMQVLARYEPRTSTAQNAEGLIQIVLGRVRAAVGTWLQNSSLPDVLLGASAQLGNMGTPESGGGLLFKAKPEGAQATQSPHAVLQRLGRGRPLDGNTRGKMENAFGASFSNVEVHADSTAARLADNMNARAFTVGNHIAFGSGEHRPGTLIGDALLAHELAHTQQQEGWETSAGTNALHGTQRMETEADQAAVGVLGKLWGKASVWAEGFAQKTAQVSRTGLKIQRCQSCSSCSAPAPPVPAIPTVRSADQRGPGTTIPDADLARELGYELDPSSRPAPAPPPPPAAPGAPPPPPPPPPARIPWDGSTGAPGAAAARTAMQAELFAAYDAYLTHFRPETLAALARPRVSFDTPAAAAGGGAPAPTGVVDIANQARAVLEARYAVSMDAAATSAAQISNRSVRQASGAGQNIFDVSSEADRSTLTGSADLAPGVAWWLFENDTPGAAGAPGSRRFATEILAAHHYSAQDPGAEQFRWDVANAYAAASTLAPNNRRQLIDYRMTGWSERGDRGITLQSSFEPGADRNRAELAQRWEIFRTATHESLHLRAHPAFVDADQGRGTMKEGFVEMFTVATLNTDVLPDVRSGSKEPLRRTVEGALSPATPNAALITNRVTPTQYAQHRAQAERIRDGGTPAGGIAHAGIGEAGVRAAFFQGHVELLGLTPTGTPLAGLRAAGATPLVHIPSGITGLDDLARRSGVARATIERDNPGITDALPATAVLTGCREHWVVAGETRANIAAQNGVSEADLVRANPDIAVDPATNDWPTLTAGHKILIPVH